jgi:hypothetical protein
MKREKNSEMAGKKLSSLIANIKYTPTPQERQWCIRKKRKSQAFSTKMSTTSRNVIKGELFYGLWERDWS